MRASRPYRLLALCVLLAVSVRCGGSPAGPSQSEGGGATIAGTVRGGGAATAPQDVTVAIAGTSLSSGVGQSGSFQIPGVPAGTVQLQFKSGATTATAQLSNVSNDQLIQIQVQLNGSTATILSESRSSGKVSLCHRTESGTYQSIEISVNAELTHRGHGDGKIGEPVPGDPAKVFGQNCQPVGASVQIKKATNGQDADEAPGPTVPVGSTVTWTYVVTNTGTVPLTGILVTDNPNGAVGCPAATLNPNQSMTCTVNGVAILGQSRTVGTVTATWTGGTVTDADASHYFGQSPTPTEEGPKVQLCHRTGNGSYHLIEVSVSAEPAHRAHGDGKVGEAVPGSPGRVFTASCLAQ